MSVVGEVRIKNDPKVSARGLGEIGRPRKVMEELQILELELVGAAQISVLGQSTHHHHQ